MLKIRLARIGKKKQPTYRLVVSEHTKDTFGDHLEKLGHYDPRRKIVELKAERIEYWMSKGAKPSKTVNNLLIEKGLIEGKKVVVSKLSKKRREKLAEKEKSKKDLEKPKDSEETKEETLKDVKSEKEDKKSVPAEVIVDEVK